MLELVLCQSRFTIAFVVIGLLVIKYRSKFVEFIGFNAHSIDTDNCVRVSFLFHLLFVGQIYHFNLAICTNQNKIHIFKFFQIEMGQMIAHQSFPFTLPISYASCNEQITSDRFNWFLFIFSHVLFHSIQISVVHNKIYFNIFNIKFNRFIHAYASFTWYQLVYVERCDISVAINCTLNRCNQTKFLFRSPNVMKRQPTSSVVHSQCYTE